MNIFVIKVSKVEYCGLLYVESNKRKILPILLILSLILAIFTVGSAIFDTILPLVTIRRKRSQLVRFGNSRARSTSHIETLTKHCA